MAKSSTGLSVMPSHDQRAFVVAATAVGLPHEMICQMMPRREGEPEPFDLRGLAKNFPEELNPRPYLGIRLVIARVLFRALAGEGPDALAAQMAVFKSMKNWSQLGQAEPPEQHIAFNRLTRSERGTLRRLLNKAAADDEGEA